MMSFLTGFFQYKKIFNLILHGRNLVKLTIGMGILALLNHLVTSSVISREILVEE
jgi:hypothetical protein